MNYGQGSHSGDASFHRRLTPFEFPVTTYHQPGVARRASPPQKISPGKHQDVDTVFYSQPRIAQQELMSAGGASLTQYYRNNIRQVVIFSMFFLGQSLGVSGNHGQDLRDGPRAESQICRPVDWKSKQATI
jgi:hypothetical protein